MCFHLGRFYTIAFLARRLRWRDAVTLGESHLRSGALNCGPEPLTNFIFVEYARRNP